MKNKKLSYALTIALLAFIILPNSAKIIEASEISKVVELNINEINNNIEPYGALGLGNHKYRKENVRTTTEWSPFRRVSSNINTYGSSGGSISTDRTTKFSGSISGDVRGLNVSTGRSISNKLGYTLTVGSNRRCYMGFRVGYVVERGVRVKTDRITGKITRNYYTAKKPNIGEYKMLNY